MRVRKNRKSLREALIVGAGAGSFKASLKGGQHIMGYRGFNESETKELSWDDFSDPVTDRIEKDFLPANGEGDSMMSQAVTATTKLIYKWFNDGDVFDNTFGLQGWANDLSDYANWLDENIPEAAAILSRIKAVGSDENAYTQLLFDLMHTVFNDEMIVKYADKPVVGTIYDCSGPYSFYTAPTCPECGQECDEWDYQHYGMCSDCYNQQWEEPEEEEYDESVKNRRKRVTESRKRYLKESEDDGDSEKDFTEEDAVQEAFPNISSHTIEIIAKWYKNEGAVEDFDNVDDFADSIRDEFMDMFWAGDYNDDEFHEVATDMINAGYYEEDDFPYGDEELNESEDDDLTSGAEDLADEFAGDVMESVMNDLGMDDYDDEVEKELIEKVLIPVFKREYPLVCTEGREINDEDRVFKDIFASDEYKTFIKGKKEEYNLKESEDDDEE
jgi:hypothetical protein